MQALEIREEQITEMAKIFDINKNQIHALSETVYAGAKYESILMVLHYCYAKGYDPLKKPVHIVPMRVKNSRTGEFEWRDTIMPGIASYRIDAARSGEYAGIGEPEYGPDVREKLGSIEIVYPRWCKVTVRKIVQGQVMEFVAMEFWKENYATKSGSDISPNMMWAKRPYGQLAKCAESQALRKAFPDVVSAEYTAEEMEGKDYIDSEVVKPKLVNIKKEKPVAKGLTDEIYNDLSERIALAQSLDELKEAYQYAKEVCVKHEDKDAYKSLNGVVKNRKEKLDAQAAQAAEVDDVESI